MPSTPPTNSDLTLDKKVFLPSALLLAATVIYSLIDNDGFLKVLNGIHQWILQHFDWMFTWGSFLTLIIVLIVYWSPVGRMRIGGKDSTPLLTKWKWFAITICTTMATGVLFWGTAEPLYHLHTPPEGLGLTPGSTESAAFAMSTVYMHWSFTPYAVYTIAGLAFAIGYYNYRQPFSISALLYPLMGSSATKISLYLDTICLYALIAGMSASLGTGMLALMGGLEINFGIEKSDFLLAIIGFSIVFTFILSSVSGLKKGIQFLSNWNIRAFFVLAAIVLISTSTWDVITIGYHGLVDYLTHFLPRSTDIGSDIEKSWQHDWTVFYLANWYAWAPIAAMFLGRIAKGYTVRAFIRYNLLFPSLFTIGWMIIFAGSSIHIDLNNDLTLYNTLTESGEESIMYKMFTYFPMGKALSIFALILIFISYVTAADSNISAMSSLATKGISPDKPEAPTYLKVIWGTMIATVTWVMLAAAGIDGVRIISVLGGFPAVFIISAVAVGMVRLVAQSPTHM